ncbi:MAG: CBM96 family carbohydrate-binding protein [Promethearchaeota archaeon]
MYKKFKNYAFAFLLVALFSLSAVKVNADWTPDDNELAPTKDTYVSITGALAEPTSNFGGASLLDVGEGMDGVCISAFQFDLSELPAEVETLEFQGDVTVYGGATRILKIYIMIGIDWDELGVTGADNPFNSTAIYTAENEDANLTTLTVVGSTTQIVVNLPDYTDSTELITLLFVPDNIDEHWISLSSKENEYLSSYSDPPRLVIDGEPVDEGSGWTPDDNELAPTKDTYVSISGYSSEPDSNFGGASSLDVGKGFDGVCISAIQFDLLELPAEVETLEFRGDVTVYSEATRILKIYIMVGIDWDELGVTGADNPFNSTAIYTAENEDANLTTLTVVGSTTQIVVNLSDYTDSTELITLLFVPDHTDEHHITMNSKENEYLSSYSDPPRLVIDGEPVDEGSAWTPDDNELAPIKDTYISITGSLAEPMSNFGGASSLDVGKGFDGVCISAFQFNLSELPAEIETLEFRGDITVYGDTTRVLKIYIMIGIDWDELGVTGADNPFNSTAIYAAENENSNLTTITITDSTTELVANLSDYSDSIELITLLFVPDYTNEHWITMSSKENPSLYSFSDPPRLVFSEPIPEEDDDGADDDGVDDDGVDDDGVDDDGVDDDEADDDGVDDDGADDGSNISIPGFPLILPILGISSIIIALVMKKKINC